MSADYSSIMVNEINYVEGSWCVAASFNPAAGLVISREK
jgi:hypothetical protein